MRIFDLSYEQRFRKTWSKDGESVDHPWITKLWKELKKVEARNSILEKH